jgi:hypothetical protein
MTIAGATGIYATNDRPGRRRRDQPCCFVTKCGTERASRHKRLGGHELRMPAPQAFGHPGNGQKCSACNEILTAARLRSRSLRSCQRSHAARCVACHGVGSHAMPVALVGECSIPAA